MPPCGGWTTGRHLKAEVGMDGRTITACVLATLLLSHGSTDAQAAGLDAGEIIALTDCKPGYKWGYKSPRVLDRREPIQRNENRTSRTQTATFTSTVSHTFTKQISAGVESEVGGGFGFVQASIRAKFGIEVVRSKTAGISNSQSVVVGPRRVAIGAYGVFKRRFVGYLVHPARQGQGGLRNKRCPRLRAVRVSVWAPLDEVGWVIRTLAI